MNLIFGENIKFRLTYWLLVLAGVMALSLFAGLVAGMGKVAYVIPVLALLSIPFLSRVSAKMRFRALLISPFLILLQVPDFHIPLGITPIALFLFGLALAELIYPSCRLSQRNQVWEYISIIPLGIFALGGLITALKTGEIVVWYTTGLVALLWFFTARRLILSTAQANQLLITTFLAVLSYLFLIFLANVTGQAVLLKPGSQDWRWIGAGQTIQFGPIKYYNQWSVTIGVFAGLGIPLAVAFLIQKRTHFLLRILALASLGAFVYIIGYTATRGAALASLAAGIVVILIMIRDRPISVLIITVAVAAFLLFYQDMLISLLPSNALQRFLELRTNLTGVDTFQYRLVIMNITVQNIAKQPLGYGYSFLWNLYRLDEAIVYSAVLNGAGVIGGFGYLLAMFQFAWRYFTSAFSIRKISSQQHTLTAIGAGVWIYGVLAGFSSQSLLLDPVHSFMFWAIIMATYHGIKSEAVIAS